MLKIGLEQKLETLLENEGYATARYHGCFDIAARKNRILLIKVLQNIDALSNGQAENLKLVASNLGASPLLVGEQTRIEKLRADVVYERYGVPSVNFQTFQRLVEDGIMPTVYSDRGGRYKRDRKSTRLNSSHN